jgi:hypothetical protein
MCWMGCEPLTVAQSYPALHGGDRDAPWVGEWRWLRYQTGPRIVALKLGWPAQYQGRR